MNARTRLSVPLTFAAIAIGLMAPAAASAGPLVASAADCQDQPLTRPFVRWLDPMSYTLLSGGSFEAGGTAWSLSGGAATVSGNQTFPFSGPGGSRSLSLPRGSSATSPTICVGLGHPTMRFFSRNTGSLLSPLRVDVHYLDARGLERELPIGLVLNGRNWAPTLPYPVVVNLLALLPGERTPIAFEFTPLGIGGAWRIDDVYVDPYRRS